MSGLVDATSDLLRAMYDESTGRFSATTSVRDGGYVSDFSGPAAVRYSLNSLLALARAAAEEDIGWDVNAATDTFLARNASSVHTIADEGMLLWLLAELGHPIAESRCARACDLAGRVRNGLRPSLQDVTWLLSGLSAYASRTGESSHVREARSLFDTVMATYVEPRSGFPLHALARWRSHLVTFGGVTYFLRALWDYGTAAQDERALERFSALTNAILERQGEWGEWPWLYHTSSGRVAEKYALYSVHQEGMAMLFLLPALSMGLAGADEAIRRSYRWILGENELGLPMWRKDPLIVHRCLRRKLPVGNDVVRSRGGKMERVLERGTAFVRASRHAAAGVSAGTVAPGSLQVNEECRSYEIGWTLFAWAGVTGFEEFTEAGLWDRGSTSREVGA